MGQICDMLTRNKYDENKSPSLRCTYVKVILKMSEKYKKKRLRRGIIYTSNKINTTCLKNNPRPRSEALEVDMPQ
jgi:hypothetical protein